MNEALGLLLILPIGIALLTGFFATVGLIFPDQVSGTQQIIAASQGRAVLIGLVNLLFFGLLALTSFAIADQSALPVLALPGLVIAALLLVGLCFGLTALVELAGERLAANAGALRQTLAGSTVISLGCAMPFVGWFLLLPYLIVLALGAQIMHQIRTYRNR